MRGLSAMGGRNYFWAKQSCLSKGSDVPSGGLIVVPTE